ncbi:MAG TPA: peptidoglycan bridge formation glycyltransferase FemA/FemB family protein [Candidatus Colwellbacteria bacterium]|nr:peptidoglycan bridge formation glycyltransferase FemA/FemB family protein [Candidatus Colwellbacteria bacterium]
MNLVEITSEKEFDPLAVNQSVPFTQSWFYGDWQAEEKREVRRFSIEDGDEIIGSLQAIRYPLTFDKSYIYIPYGPVLKNNLTEKTAAFLKKSLKEVFNDGKTVFIRLDFWPALKDRLEKTAGKFFVKSPRSSYRGSNFQPRAERVIDLKQPENEIFFAMEPKARYNVRLALKKGVVVKTITKNFLDYFEDFYSLMTETANRDGFSLHPRSYYEEIFNSAEKRKNAFLALAFYGDTLLVANLVVLYGETAFFLFGSSSSEYRELMPSYLCQWQSLRKAKELGFSYYSFGGISHKGLNRSWEGISVYKKKFGGFVREYSPFYDLAIQPFWYYLYILRKAFFGR